MIDPGHGGSDLGVVVPDGLLRWTEADLAYDIAARLEGRLAAAGMRVHLTRGPNSPTTMSDRGARQARQRPRRRPVPLDPPRRTQEPAGRRRRDLPLRHGRRRRLDGRRAAGRAGAARDRHADPAARLPYPREVLGSAAADPDAGRTGRGRLPDLAGRPGPAGRPAFRERVVEALIAAVQRMYFPVEQDVPTGSIDVSSLRLLSPRFVASRASAGAG